jgi:hypothetical protein
MASIVGSAQQTSPTVAGEGSQRQVRLMRDGATVGMDWIQAAVAQGVVHTAGTGTGTSPTTLNPVYGDALQDFYLYVPAGTVIVPLFIGVALEDTGTILGIDTLAAYSSNGDGAVTGSALTVYNFKTLASPATACIATAVVTSGGTTHLAGTDFAEFWRPYAGLIPDHFASAATINIEAESGPNGAHWSAKDYPAPMVGSAGTDCALSVFAGAQAGIGFITVVWAEYPASQFA